MESKVIGISPDIYLFRKLLFLITVGILFSLTGCQTEYEILNPYKDVDWAGHGRYKANFHTHTTQSDGWLNPHMVVDNYHYLNYDILAITDHNFVTYPWEKFSELEINERTKRRVNNGLISVDELMYKDRNPDSLGMIAIQGNELSRHHHMGSYFNNHNNTESVESSLAAITEKNGLAVFFHPGRYDHPVEWYVDLYKRYDVIIGQEVYNQGDRYTDDRGHWDSVLTVMMPNKAVWGFSNDDMHRERSIGHNWNILLLPELTEEYVRSGIENGLFFFVYAPEGHEGPNIPYIESINIDSKRGIIDIEATGHEYTTWVSDGKIVYRGDVLSLSELDEPAGYVRAMLYESEGGAVIGTQPFGIIDNR
jgi:hypothetical protein